MSLLKKYPNIKISLNCIFFLLCMSFKIIPLFHIPLYTSKIELTDTETQDLINQEYEKW